MAGVRLGRRFEQFISALIASGRYKSRTEVLQEAVRLVQRREKRVAALDRILKTAKSRARSLS